MKRAVPAHWLRRNEAEWTPRRIVCLDTEARRTPTDVGQLHTFRLGCFTFDVRDGDDVPASPLASGTTLDEPTALWETITALTSDRHVTYLYAHNLAYDVAVSKALVALPRLGWEVKQAALDNRGTYLRLRHGRRSLVLADSVSLFPVPLETVGRVLGLGLDTDDTSPDVAGVGAARRRDLSKLPLPDDDDGTAAWEARCRRDVEILREAVLQLMAWWDREHMGHWSITGPGLGWAVLRHRFLQDKLLVHRDPDVTALERAAYFGGRREVFRVGPQPKGRYPYLDFRTHYARIVADHPVPVRLMGTCGAVPLDRYRSRRPDVGLIAEVEIETRVPCAPVRTEVGTAYPIGTFRTFLCGPEIELADAEADHLSILHAAYFHLRPALRPWGVWITDALAVGARSVPPAVRLAAKGWSRSVTGKFGQTSRQTKRIGETYPADCRVEPFRHAQTGIHGALVAIGGSIFETSNLGESDNAMPAVAAWITSLARVELWRLMQYADPQNVLWCDTDGIVLDGADAPHPSEAPAGPGPDGRPEFLTPEWWLPQLAGTALADQIGVKDVYRTVHFRLPGEYALDGEPHIRGLRRNAVQRGSRKWSAELWPSLPQQITAHHGHAYETRNVDIQFRRTYDRGVIQPDGRVTPLVMMWDGQQNVITNPA